MSQDARQNLSLAFEELNDEGLKKLIARCQDSFGEQAAKALRELHQELSLENGIRLSDQGDCGLVSAARRLRERYEANLDLSFAQPTRTPAPQRGLSKAQRQVGALTLDRILGVTEEGVTKWIGRDGRWGISARGLMESGWSLSDRIYLSMVLLDGLSALHDQRLEPTEGFDPDRMWLNARFEICVPKGSPTTELSLLSPERKGGDGGGAPSDVWALAQLFIALYTDHTLGVAKIDDDAQCGIIPVEVKRVLERCLHPIASERLYSAKEVRVVITGPLERWLDRISYEGSQEESGELAALPYEEATAQKEEQDQVRAKRRRLRELNLRRALQWRATKRQATVSIIFVVVLAVIFVQYSLKVAREEAAREARITQIAKYAQAFDIEDEHYQASTPESLKTVSFKWRFIPGDEELSSFLISKTEVTHAQYRACVDAGSCEPLSVQEGCVWGVEGHDEDPINCLSFYQARAFAQYSGGEIPTVEQWIWSATRDGAHDFPWGNEVISPEHANLDFDSPQWERGVRAVCQFRYGDSTRGLCDLVGGMAEWVIISETGEVGGYYQLRSGVMGGSWLTAPELIDMDRPKLIEAKNARYDIGIRVVKKL